MTQLSYRKGAASGALSFSPVALNIETSHTSIFVAGQAVVACIEGMEIERVHHCSEEDDVSIDVVEPELPDGHIWNHRDRAAAKSMIRALLAGPAAQERYSFGAVCGGELLRDDDTTGQACVWRAIGLAGRIESSVAVIEPLWLEVGALISRPDVWDAVERVAASLAASEELVGCELEEIVRSAIPDAMR